MREFNTGVAIVHIMLLAAIVFGLYDYHNNNADALLLDIKVGCFYGSLVIIHHVLCWRQRKKG